MLVKKSCIINLIYKDTFFYVGEGDDLSKTKIRANYDVQARQKDGIVN